MKNKNCGDYGCYGIFVNEKAMYQAMFWWIRFPVSNGISITIEKSILLFIQKHNLPEESIDIDSAKDRYNKFNNSLIERMKNG